MYLTKITGASLQTLKSLKLHSNLKHYLLINLLSRAISHKFCATFYSGINCSIPELPNNTDVQTVSWDGVSSYFEIVVW